MPKSVSETSAGPSGPALSDILLAAAHNVRAVLSGRSLSDSLAQTPAGLRAGAQAISFHAMRRLGLAGELRSALVRRVPPNPLFDALLLVSLVVLDAACAAAAASPAATATAPTTAPATTAAAALAAGDEQKGRQADAAGRVALRRDVPVYAVHTVVDQAVCAAASQSRLASYKGLLNGVLRNFLRGRDQLLERALRTTRGRWNHPEWWVRLLERAYPDDWQALLLAADEPGPMTLRVNVRRNTPAELLARLRQAGIEAQPLGAAGIVLERPCPVQQIPGFEQGLWSVQDAAAQQAASLLAPADGMRVLDACAAPGGKTAHLLESADIELQALDADAGRLERVAQNLRRLGLDGPQVSLRCADAADVEQWWDGRPYDAVLADVPCTASGIVRRHPDIRWLRREADVARTAALQRRIADALWRTVKPGGRLLYATCSIFPQEGRVQAEQFAGRHPDALRLPAPGQLLPLPGQGAASMYDGFYYALFAKKP